MSNLEHDVTVIKSTLAEREKWESRAIKLTVAFFVLILGLLGYTNLATIPTQAALAVDAEVKKVVPRLEETARKFDDHAIKAKAIADELTTAVSSQWVKISTAHNLGADYFFPSFRIQLATLELRGNIAFRENPATVGVLPREARPARRVRAAALCGAGAELRACQVHVHPSGEITVHQSAGDTLEWASLDGIRFSLALPNE